MIFRLPLPTQLVVRVCSLVLAASSFLLFGMVSHAGSVSFTYDALGRIASAVYSDGTLTTTITYSYDAAGNRTSVVTTSP